MAAIELYKCICGVYVTEKLKLCEQCASQYGNDYTKWPFWLRSLYQDVNFGRNYELDLSNVRAAPLGTAKARAREKDAPKMHPIRTGRRNCPVCLTPIRVKDRLCDQCFAKYGSNQKEWPLWLQVLVTNDQKRADYARNHRETSINDETFTRRQALTRPGRAGGKIPGSYGGRTLASVNQDNLSFDQIEWLDNDLEIPEDTDTAPGSIRGDKSGHRYNAAVWRGSNEQYQELGGLWERDLIENKIDNDREIEQSDYTRQIAILLYGAGHIQSEIGRLLGLEQQRVSELLGKRDV